MSDLFWKRWLKEYLPQLQQRQKWNKIQRNFIAGDIVLVVEDSAFRIEEALFVKSRSRQRQVVWTDLSQRFVYFWHLMDYLLT